ncbi:MAG: agarase [Prolixibacteraceae bacterium]
MIKIFTAVVMLLFSCPLLFGQKKDAPAGKQGQQYIMVDAQKRISKNGKSLYTAYEPFQTRTVDLLTGFHPVKKGPAINKYGGLKKQRATTTGFFHVEKIGDRWWGVDPEGCLYFNMAINSISMGKSPRNEKAVIDKFGTPQNWMKQTIGMLQQNGFNCAGSWSDYQSIVEANRTIEKPLAYTINWNFMSGYGRVRGGTFQQPGHTGYPNDAIFVFDPGFETFCDSHARQVIAFKDDPNLFGYFSDNEMPFKLKSLDNFLALPDSESGRKAAEQWLKDKGISKEQITDEHREEFMALVGEKYFSIISKAIKKYDPNHMYIGARFYSEEKNHEKFMTAVGKYLDVVSNNYYNYWTPDSAQLANWTKWTGRPFIITEYYTKGEDSGMPNQSGAGWIVRTQKDRGLFYQNYNLALIESKNCVGWHYFKYQDNDPDAKGVDPSNTDANKGIVNNYYEVWQPMMDKMRELNSQVYNLIDYFDGK